MGLVKTYGQVHIGKSGALGAIYEQEILKDMNRLGIIIVTEEELRDIYEEDRKKDFGGQHLEFRLRNLKELIGFTRVMRSPQYEFGMQDVSWRISLSSANPEVSKKLRERIRKKHAAEKLHRDGMSMADIAKKMEIPESTVRNWLKSGAKS